MNTIRSALASVTLFAIGLNPYVRADAVTDWNATFEATLQNPSERGPRVPARILAIMHVAMFDAVNGIERKYEPCHVTDRAPPGARAEAAAIQAAYTALSTLRPASQAVLDAQFQISLAALAGEFRTGSCRESRMRNARSNLG